MNQKRILVTAVVLAMSVVSHFAYAQTTTTSTTTTAASPGATGTTSTTGTTGATTTNTSAPVSASETQYVSRIAPRFGAMAGSSSNLESLVHGLRTGSEVKLSGTSTNTATSSATGTSTTAGTSTTSGTSATSGTSSTSTGTSVTFTPETRPMGYGNITRTLDLASKQLAAAGITNPTSQDLAAALNGGTVKTAQGSTTFEGILKLRAEGMGWGKIAHTIGVHPGMGKSAAHHQAGTVTNGDASSSATTAAGSASTGASKRSESSKGVVTASGRTQGATGNARSNSRKGVVTASGAGATPQATGKGIATAGGAVASHGHGHGPKVQPGAGMVSASGAAAGAGVTTASANSRGNAYGRNGKN